MKATQNNTLKLKMMVSLGALLIPALVGCSEVSFTPSQDLTSKDLEVPPPDSTDKTISETFLFDRSNTKKYVDVLFIIDNSGSMLAEQEKLGQRLNSFITSLDEVDWQIGITTTDASNGTFGIKGSLVNLDSTSQKILKPTLSNYESLFMNSVVRNESIDCQTTAVCPTNNEQALLAAIMAMDKRNSTNAGFFRDNADLAVVILTDEDEMSSGPPEATKPQQVVDHFKSIWGTSKNLSVYGIVVQPGDRDCYDSQYLTAGTYGYHVTELALITGGVTGSICDTDYSHNLSKIGENVNQLLNYVVLTHEPESGVLNVVLTPHDPELTWSLEGQRVVFNKTPAEGTRVDIVYERK